ncbi:MAG: hypothetical protein ABIN45_00790, partial [Gammaproteobacteria bacterium]
AFFEQWLNRSGAPEISADNLKVQSLPGRPVAYLASFNLTQSAPAYTLRVPIQIKTAHGDVERILDLNDVEQRYTVELDTLPLTLSIDPDLRLFRRITADEMPPLLRQVMTDAATLTVITGHDAALRKTAVELAGKLLDSAPRITDDAHGRASVAGDRTTGATGNTTPLSDPPPLLVIGTHDETAAYLQKQRLPAAPQQLTGKGSARVWAAKQPNGKVIVVISAASTEALHALIRPLPHYGKESYLVFEDGKVIERGVWPAEGKIWKFSE